MEVEKGNVNDRQSKWWAKAGQSQLLKKYSTLSLMVLGCFYILRAWQFSGIEHEVKLADIPVLTFKRGQRTTGRLFREVPQLQCVASGASGRECFYDFVETPKEVRCYNKGLDGNNKVVWDCKADFGFPQTDPRMFKQVSVNCEGSYIYPDEYVLKGSCYLIYNAEPVPDGCHAVINIIMLLSVLAYAYNRWISAKMSTTTTVITTNNPNVGTNSYAPSNPNPISSPSTKSLVLWSGVVAGAVADILWGRHDILPISLKMMLFGVFGVVISFFLLFIFKGLHELYRQFQRLLSLFRQ